MATEQKQKEDWTARLAKIREKQRLAAQAQRQVPVMAGTTNKPRHGKATKHSKSTDDLIKQHIGRDPARLPPDFKKTLAEEIAMLRLPLSTSGHPFKPGPPWAVESEYVQTGLFHYVFADLDYAIIRYVFDIDHPGKLKKSRLKDWLVNKCAVPLAQLEGLSWQDISDFSWSAIERDIAPNTTMLPETEQSPGIRKLGWRGCLLKLYEKMLKVVVDAILERIWPK